MALRAQLFIVSEATGVLSRDTSLVKNGRRAYSYSLPCSSTLLTPSLKPLCTNSEILSQSDTVAGSDSDDDDTDTDTDSCTMILTKKERKLIKKRAKLAKSGGVYSEGAKRRFPLGKKGKKHQKEAPARVSRLLPNHMVPLLTQQQNTNPTARGERADSARSRDRRFSCQRRQVWLGSFRRTSRRRYLLYSRQM